MKFLQKKIFLKPESDQASISNYQFTGNIEHRNMLSHGWGCKQQNPICRTLYRTNCRGKKMKGN